MTDLLGFSLISISAVFFVVDPMGLLPIFAAMTASDSPAKRRAMALRATLVAFGVLTAFALFGTLVIRVFGVSLAAFKVAGGLLLMLTALDMLRAQPSRTRSTPEEQSESQAKEDVAIVPLAMPLLAGPGAIATVMVLAARGGTWVHTIPVVLSVAITCLAAYLLLCAVDSVNRLLGRTGIAILERVMGLLLAAIAVQFVADGALELFGPRGGA